jgi:putative hydrolase of the HAD superfamily
MTSQPSIHHPAPIEAVIFDLGGVLIHFDFERAHSRIAELSGLDSKKVRERIVANADFLAFESGDIDERQFHLSVQKSLDCTLPYETFKEFWNGIFKQEATATVELARQLRRTIKVGLLSNTNVLHFDYLKDRMSVLSELDHVFVSHEMRCRKPTPQSYQHVLQVMQLPPERVVFVDDLAENIAGARAVGMHGIHATDEAAVKLGLQQLGLLI